MFRPCIDLHGGKVKQIVGSTLSDDASSAPVENFVASRSAAEFAELYRRDGLAGGHVIMLGPGNEEAALSALRAYPGGLQVVLSTKEGFKQPSALKERWRGSVLPAPR